jgi:hypothetical protein
VEVDSKTAGEVRRLIGHWLETSGHLRLGRRLLRFVPRQGAAAR